MLGKLQERSTAEELMDDFQGTETELKSVLNDINRVNRLLGGSGITIKAVAQLIHNNPQEHYLIMDVGCADGTMLRELAVYCRKYKIKADFIGVDLNPDALHIAREASTNFPEIKYRLQNVLHLKETDQDCDILISTLTTHHIPNEQLLPLLRQCAKLSKLGFVNNDLHRSALALVLFKLFSIFFIRTETARRDGLTSIRRGFKRRDLQHFADQLTNMNHFIKWKWAFRYVWIMEPKRPIAR